MSFFPFMDVWSLRSIRSVAEISPRSFPTTKSPFSHSNPVQFSAIRDRPLENHHLALCRLFPVGGPCSTSCPMTPFSIPGSFARNWRESILQRHRRSYRTGRQVSLSGCPAQFFEDAVSAGSFRVSTLCSWRQTNRITGVFFSCRGGLLPMSTFLTLNKKTGAKSETPREDPDETPSTIQGDSTDAERLLRLLIV